MARRLFHAIVLVGTGMGAACASRDAPAPITDGATSADSGAVADGELDTFPGIMPMMIDSSVVATDSNITDTSVKLDSSTSTDAGAPDTPAGG